VLARCKSQPTNKPITNPDSGAERNLGGHADKDAERQPDHPAEQPDTTKFSYRRSSI
jgi:hypothetical protein